MKADVWFSVGEKIIQLVNLMFDPRHQSWRRTIHQNKVFKKTLIYSDHFFKYYDMWETEKDMNVARKYNKFMKTYRKKYDHWRLK